MFLFCPVFVSPFFVSMLRFFFPRRSQLPHGHPHPSHAVAHEVGEAEEIASVTDELADESARLRRQALVGASRRADARLRESSDSRSETASASSEGNEAVEVNGGISGSTLPDAHWRKPSVLQAATLQSPDGASPDARPAGHASGVASGVDNGPSTATRPSANGVATDPHSAFADKVRAALLSDGAEPVSASVNGSEQSSTGLQSLAVVTETPSDHVTVSLADVSPSHSSVPASSSSAVGSQRRHAYASHSNSGGGGRGFSFFGAQSFRDLSTKLAPLVSAVSAPRASGSRGRQRRYSRVGHDGHDADNDESGEDSEMIEVEAKSTLKSVVSEGERWGPLLGCAGELVLDAPEQYVRLRSPSRDFVSDSESRFS